MLSLEMLPEFPGQLCHEVSMGSARLDMFQGELGATSHPKAMASSQRLDSRNCRHSWVNSQEVRRGARARK